MNRGHLGNSITLAVKLSRLTLNLGSNETEREERQEQANNESHLD